MRGMEALRAQLVDELIFSVFIAVSGCFASGCAAGYTSPVESAIMDDLSLTVAQFSLFASMLTVGGLIGSLISGKISDLIGRRAATGVADVLSLLGWITISISQEAWSLDLGRFFIGVSVGLLVYVIPIYIAEITPKNLRGGLVSSTMLVLSCGLVVMYFVGSLIPWRLLVLIGIIPSFVQLVGIFLIPESPRFLAKLGHYKEQEMVLQQLRGNSIDISHQIADIQESTRSLEQIPEVTFLGLFQRKYARSLVVVFGLMALGGLAGPSGVTYYASSIFDAAGFSSSIGSIVLALIQLPSNVVSMYLIDKCGRRPLIMISAVAMCISCFLVGLMFFLKEIDCLESINGYVIVVGLWGYSAAYFLGMAGIPSVIMSEVFPMNVKGSAGSLAVVVSSVTMWIASYTFNFMTDWSYSGTFFILALFNAFTVLFVGKLMPETKGKTLEDIQQTFNTCLAIN